MAHSSVLQLSAHNDIFNLALVLLRDISSSYYLFFNPPLQ